MNSELIRASRLFRKLASSASQLWACALIPGWLAGIAAAQPVNDHFSNRTLIPSLPATVNGDTTGSTLEAGDPMTGRSIWWKFTPQTSGSHFISAYPAYSNSYRLHLYGGNSPGTLVKQEGQLIVGTPTYTRLEKFELTAGVEYSILVGSMADWDFGPVTLKVNRNSPPAVSVTHPTAGKPVYHGTALELRVDASDPDGNVARVDYYLGPHYYEGSSQPVASSTVAPFSATMTVPPAGTYHEKVFAVVTDNQGAKIMSASVSFLITEYVAPPPNDQFADRILIPALPATVSGNSGGSTYEDGEPVAARSIWWKFIPQASGSHYISAYPNGSINDRFQLYTGDSLGALVKLNGQLVNGAPVGTRMEKFELSAGVEYSVRIGSQSTHGDDPVTLTVTPNSPPSISITNPVDDMPYYVGTDLELRVNASDPDGNVVQVDYYYDSYDAGGTSLPIATSTVPPFTSTVTLPPAGDYYQRILAVATDNSGAKTVSDSVRFLITYNTPNDFFANRKVITGNRIFELGDNQYATAQAGEPGGGSKSIWWSWTAPVSGTFVISSRGWPAGFMPSVDIYTGSSLDALTHVGSGTASDLSTTYTAQVSLDATAGQTYEIRVATVLGLGGEAGLSILPLSPPGTPPQLEILPFSDNGKIEFMVLTNSAVSTELQRSPDLKTWTPFTSTTYPPNGYFKEIYPRPSESSYFYRIVEKAPSP